MLACLSGLEQTVQNVLKCNPSLVHQIGARGRTALTLVCSVTRIVDFNSTERLSALNLLLEHGSNVNTRDAKGMTPFLSALENQRIRVERDEPEDEELAMFVHEFLEPKCCSDYRKNVLERLLVVEPMVIDQRDVRGRTSLMIAAQGTDLSAVQLLLSHKRDAAEYINAQDDEGMTAFLHACHVGTPEIVKALLVQPCLDVEHRCHRGLSAMDWLFHTAYDKMRLGVLWVLTRSRPEHGQWEASAVCKVSLRALDVSSREGSPLNGSDFAFLWNLTFRSFSWNLQDSDTIVLLAYAARQRCRVYVVLILQSLGLLPKRLDWQMYGRIGTGICDHQSDEDWDEDDHYDLHCSFDLILKTFFMGEVRGVRPRSVQMVHGPLAMDWTIGVGGRDWEEFWNCAFSC